MRSVRMLPIGRIALVAVVWFVVNFFSASSLAAAAAPVLRIGLATQQFGYLASGNGPIEIVDAGSGKVLSEFAPGSRVRIGLRDGQLVINNAPANAEQLTIRSKAPGARLEREDRLVELNNRRYRGVLEIFRTPEKKGLTAVNVLSVDDYVYALMLRDVSPEWPLEALKALAVTERTYAVHGLGTHKVEGFDLCATSHCQTYTGQGEDDGKVQQAVQETQGRVMTWQGQLIAAPFHLSSGGYTENGDDLWPEGRSYLRGVPDADQTSPYFRWQKKLAPQELEGLLKGGGYDIGSLSAIEVSKRKPAPMFAADRGVSGRIRHITLIGKNGVATLTGEQFRELLALPSSLVDVTVAVTVADISSTITDSYGDTDTKQIEIKLPPTKQGGLLNDREDIQRITGRKDEMIYLDGYGFGHGVGLSLWGAKTMAEKAINPGPDYYRTILKHYYQGVTIDKWY